MDGVSHTQQRQLVIDSFRALSRHIAVKQLYCFLYTQVCHCTKCMCMRRGFIVYDLLAAWELRHGVQGRLRARVRSIGKISVGESKYLSKNISFLENLSYIKQGRQHWYGPFFSLDAEKNDFSFLTKVLPNPWPLHAYYQIVFLKNPSGSSLCSAGIYYAATMVMVSLSLAMSVVVLNLHHRGPETHQVPPWLRKIVQGKVGRMFMMRRTPTRRDYDTYRKRRWKALSSIEMEPLDTAVNGWEDRLDNSMPSANELDSRKQINSLRSASSARLREISLLESIREEFRMMREMAIEKEKSERCQNDWKQVALVVDRIFMVIFFLGMLCTLFIIVSQFNFN